ncbi:MAG: hypothetical protein V4662_16180 [Verrucomicrobiota bacterium]
MPEYIAPQMVVIPWYLEEDWAEWKRIASDEMCLSFQGWKDKATRLFGDLARKDTPVTTQVIDPKHFVGWCKLKGLSHDGHSRSVYASSRLVERIKDFESNPINLEAIKGSKANRNEFDGQMLSELLEPFLFRPKAGCCPIFRLRKDRPEQFGTGTLLKLGTRRFMLTASHVLDDIIDGNALVPGIDGWPFLNGEVIGTVRPESGDRKDDKNDLGIIHLDREVVSAMHPTLIFLEGSEIDGAHVTEERGAYIIAGFPAERTKLSGSNLEAHPFTFSGDGVRDYRYRKLGRNLENHLLIQHRQKKAIHYQTMRKGVKLSFEGVSGGGVFAWDKRFPHPVGFVQPKLVAIVHEYNHHWGVFIATKLSYYLTMMHKRYPDLPIQGIRTE